jgi:hypothetical protein
MYRFGLGGTVDSVAFIAMTLARGMITFLPGSARSALG